MLHKRIFRTVLSLVFVFASIIGFAENEPLPENAGKITGTVQDAGTNGTIPYATVALYKKADSALVTGTVTDENGKFSIDKVPNGSYYLTIHFIGYNKKIIKDISLERGNRNVDFGTILLKKAVEALEEVEVSAERDAIQYKIDRKVINVEKNLQAKGGTVVDALENTPSIQTDAEGNVSLRGSSDFTVLIDGKPTSLSGQDILKQIPAAAVENIEIITNPSVKYDPEGTAGIINIIMKKEYKEGVNGIVNASIGNRLQHSGDFNINYRTKKVNYFIGAGYADRPRYPSSEIYNETMFNDTLRIIEQNAEREQRQKSYNINAGADFYLTDSDMLTISGKYGYWGWGMEMDALTKESSLPVSQANFINTLTDMNMGGHYINTNVNYDHDFGENHDWVTSFFYSNWDGDDYTDVNELNTDESWKEVLTQNRYKYAKHTYNDEWRIKTDYTQPLGDNGKLEAGYQYRMKDETSDFTFSDYNTDTENWEKQDAMSNSMNFIRGIHSVYSTYGNQIAGIQYQAGLRGEYTDRNLTTIGEEYPQQKFNFFPSLHLSRQFKAGNQLQAGYSRRVNRPKSWHLNPFPRYSDRYMRQGGNPDLRPEFTDSYELNYMKRFKIGFASLETYYRQTNDSHEQVMNLDEDGIVVINTENLDKSYAYGAELSSNIRPAKWLNIYASANIYNYSIEGENISPTADVNSLKTDFTLNLTLMASKNTRIQLTGFYMAPTITSQGMRSEMYGMNAAISQDLLDRKLSLSLNAKDVFQTMNFAFNSQSEGLKTDFTFHMDSPSIRFTASYKINNYQKRKEETPGSGSAGGAGGGIL